MRDHVPAVPARLRGHPHVFERRGIGQDIGDLIRARDALLRDCIGGQSGDLVAVENDAARGRPQHPGQAIEERAFAGAVRTDNGADFVAFEVEIHVRQRRKPAELDGQHFGRQNGCRRRSPIFRRGANVDRRLRAHLSGEVAGRRGDCLFPCDHLAQMGGTAADLEDELARERLMIFLAQHLVALRKIIALLHFETF